MCWSDVIYWLQIQLIASYVLLALSNANLQMPAFLFHLKTVHGEDADTIVQTHTVVLQLTPYVAVALQF